jgi:multiple sugar transport system permease protein
MTTTQIETTADSARPPSRRRPLVHIGLIGFGLVMLYPLLWMFSSAFKPNALIFVDPGLWPSEWTLENFSQGWNLLGVTFGRFFWNSFVISALSVVGNLFACSLAAYAFARLEFRLKKVLFAVMLMTIMLPFHVTVVPQYIVFHYLGWVNTFYPLIVPRFLAVEGFFVFLLVQFIRGLPRDLDDAARVDGCASFGVYWYIILPLMKPGLAVVAVFTFIWSWNDFFTPLLYLTSPDNYTVPLGLRSFLDATGESNWGAMFAMNVLSLVPIFFVFLFAQKYLVRGIATTGLK